MARRRHRPDDPRPAALAGTRETPAISRPEPGGARHPKRPRGGRSPVRTTGRDAGKKVPGRKRGLAVDVLGLVIAVVVLAASVHDNAAGIVLLDRLTAACRSPRAKAKPSRPHHRPRFPITPPTSRS
ncbi:transposase [Microbispora bryophytorum]|uniref:transposase n=1 Tax=Microbispora bryophytorum TaxID=1460882 RepID=UPI0033D5FE19